MQKTYGLSADYTKREINRYYSDRNMIKPKIANKAAVFGLLKSGKSLETIIEEAKSQNCHIPDAYQMREITQIILHHLILQI